MSMGRHVLTFATLYFTMSVRFEVENRSVHKPPYGGGVHRREAGNSSDMLRRQKGASVLWADYKRFHDQKSCENTYWMMEEDIQGTQATMQEWVTQCAARTGGKPVCAPLKSVDRACQKIENDYDDAWQLTDLVRCSIIYNTSEALCAGAAKLKGVMLQGSYLNDRRCVDKRRCSGIVKLKNRFAEPQGGYADIMTNVLLQSEGYGWQIAELQLHLAPVIVAKDPALAHVFSADAESLLAELQQRFGWSTEQLFQGGHHYYEVSRSPDADEEQHKAAEEAMQRLYSSALAMAGCTNLADGNVQKQIAQSQHCQCLPKISAETFNMDLDALHEMLMDR
mmetsp:Transcript_52220/g.98021  ORF Transcript_52220/g.98021 Transcript_52220/m.98021 type:complete len:337 (-) Transcript_52220:82-1092(-)